MKGFCGTLKHRCRSLAISLPIVLAACSNANSVDGIWMLDMVATRQAKGYQDSVSADQNTEMALNFLAQTQAELNIQKGQFHYLGSTCTIKTVGDANGVICSDRKGTQSTRTISLKDNKLWIVPAEGYPEIFVRVK